MKFINSILKTMLQTMLGFLLYLTLSIFKIFRVRQAKKNNRPIESSAITIFLHYIQYNQKIVNTQKRIMQHQHFVLTYSHGV